MEWPQWLTIWHWWTATRLTGIIKFILLYSLVCSPKHLCHSLLHQLPDPERAETPSTIRAVLHSPDEKHQQAKQPHFWGRAMCPKNAGLSLPKAQKSKLMGTYKGSEELSQRPCWLLSTTFQTKAEPPSCSCLAAAPPLKTPSSFPARHVSLPPPCRLPLTPTARAPGWQFCAGIPGFCAWERSSQPCSPAALQHPSEGTLHPETAALTQPRPVPSQLPLQTGPTRVLPLMSTADKDCTANLLWPPESYLGVKTAEAL